MEQFTISRPTLREAFRILESEGLITVRRGARGGARVMEPSADATARYAGVVLQHRGATVADVLDARVIVEAPAARMLASRRDRAAIARKLQDKLDELGTDEPARFHEFNALVVDLTGNQTLVLITAMLEHISQAAALQLRAPAPRRRRRPARPQGPPHPPEAHRPRQGRRRRRCRGPVAHPPHRGGQGAGRGQRRHGRRPLRLISARVTDGSRAPGCRTR